MWTRAHPGLELTSTGASLHTFRKEVPNLLEKRKNAPEAKSIGQGLHAEEEGDALQGGQVAKEQVSQGSQSQHPGRFEGGLET